MTTTQAKNTKKNKRFSIQYIVVSIFLFATLFTATATIAICLQFYFTKQMAHENALNSFSVNAQTTSKYLNTIDRKARNSVKLLSQYTPIISGNVANDNINTIFAELIRNTPYFYSIYIGFANGNSYEVVNLEADNPSRWIFLGLIPISSAAPGLDKYSTTGWQ